MDDDIIEIKPTLGPFTVNIRALVRRLGIQGKSDPVVLVAERFLRLFLEHGIPKAQIPRLIPQLTLEKLRTTESLLPALSTQVLESAATIFGGRLSWLEGADDRIYERLSCYKQPQIFFDLLTALNIPLNGFAVRALATTKALDCRNDRTQQLALVLVEKVQDFGSEEIVRYHVYGDAWDWSHPPCRIQLKAMVRLIFHTSHRPVPLHQVKPAILRAIIEGKCVPHAALHGCLLTSPSLEDFALSREESVQAKETDELPAVLDYICEHDLSQAGRQQGA